jgi:mannan endo-1,4-beta-mannosidase
MPRIGVIRSGAVRCALHVVALAALLPACRAPNPFFSPGGAGGPGARDATTTADMAPAMEAAAPVDVAPVAETAPVADAMSPSPEVPAAHGLQGEYFLGESLQGSVVLRRTDQTIDFLWKDAAPGDGVPADGFSVRWSGWISSKFAESYTFTTTTDDGVRLWIDGDNLIDSWTLQSSLERTSKPVPMLPGVLRRITIEYYEHAFTATARLSWASSSQPREIVPFAQLWLP